MKSNKKKIIIYIFLLVAIIIIFSIKIYYNYYFIDFSNFSEIKRNGVYFSPNREYSVNISLVKLRDKKNEYYILGELIKTEFIAENYQIVSDKNTRIVYWDKQQGDFDENIIYVKWFNNKQFQIKNEKLNIYYKNYDYRRNK